MTTALWKIYQDGMNTDFKMNLFAQLLLCGFQT